MVLVWLAGLGASALASNVRINEVLYDPTGADAGLGWVELCNSGATDEDITGWTVQTAGSTWSTSYTFTAGTVPAGGFLLVGAGSTSHAITFNPNLPNGGSDTDGIRLVDASSATVDTLLYDTPNTNALVDDSGAAGTSFAVDVSSPNYYYIVIVALHCNLLTHNLFITDSHLKEVVVGNGPTCDLANIKVSKCHTKE